MTTRSALHAHIKAIAPMSGISVGDPANRSTWRISFLPEATDEQKNAAQAALLTFVEPAETPELSNKEILQLLLDKKVLSADDVSKAHGKPK